MNLEQLNKYYEDGWLIKQVHPTLPLTIWNYSQNTQYEGKWDEITLQCRGLVTDDKGNVVARPFKKFFNMEEGKHTPTSEFEVFEKMDGSLIIAFYMWGELVVATRGSFTSEQSIAAKNLLHTMNTYSLTTGVTYLFEYTSSWNRIVVDYGDKENLTLLAAIDSNPLVEAPYVFLQGIATQLGCDVVKKYDGIKDYSILKGIIKDNQEGFVIKFSNGDRMKIKGEEYLRLHRIMTMVSTKSVWEVLSSGGDLFELIKDTPDEFFDKIDEYADQLNTRFLLLESEYKWLYNKFRNVYFETHKVEFDRATFAKLAKGVTYPSILFSMLDGKDYHKLIWNIIKPEYNKL